jgi:hypothetical protein
MNSEAGQLTSPMKVVSPTNTSIESQSCDFSGGRVGGVHRYVQLQSLQSAFLLHFGNKLCKHNDFGMSTVQKFLLLNQKVNI